MYELPADDAELLVRECNDAVPTMSSTEFANCDGAWIWVVSTGTKSKKKIITHTDI